MCNNVNDCRGENAFTYIVVLSSDYRRGLTEFIGHFPTRDYISQITDTHRVVPSVTLLGNGVQ
jgi:hypothetical protein